MISTNSPHGRTDAAELTFWKNEHNINLGSALVLLRSGGNDPHGRWPGPVPPLSTLLHELGLAKMAYVNVFRPKGKEQWIVEVLTGRLLVRGSIQENSERAKRLWLNKKGLSYADNVSRARIVAKGVRIALNGIECHTGQEFNALEHKDVYWKSGRYVDKLLELTSAGNGQHHEDVAFFAEDESTTGSADELLLLDTLQQYIDAEHELEELAARQTPAFSYVAKRAEPRRTVYRQFLRLTLTQGDYERLCNLAPGLLRFDCGEDDEGPVAQVVDLSPTRDKPEIIVSIERQTSEQAIGEFGQLYLAAVPTLKKVRSTVLESLRARRSDNPWLVSVAAGEYAPSPYLVPDTAAPPAQFPPTPSQLRAFRMGLGTPDYVLVLGPPGTGKTTVILNWVRALVAKGERVLVTSQNNKAVDNVLERLAEEKDLRCVRIGSETKVATTLHPILFDNAATQLQILLMDQIERTTEYLEQARRYLDEVRRRLPEFEQARQRCVSLQQQYRDWTEQNLRPCELRREQVEKAERQCAERLSELRSRLLATEQQHASWRAKPLWTAPVSMVAGLVHGIRQRSITRQLGKAEDSLMRARDEAARVRVGLAAAMRKQEDIRQTLDKTLAASADSWPIAPACEVAELSMALPLDDEYETSLSDTLEQRRRRLAGWMEAVSQWRTTLSEARQQALYQLALQMVDVVGATCVGINTNPAFREIPFDTVIVDESGQIQLHNLIVPLSRARRAILVGDHNQLPPVVQPELLDEVEARGADAQLLKRSWFEILWEVTGHDRKVILDTQYRCPAVISDFISKAFYDGKYLAGKGMEAKQPLFSFTRSPILFIDTAALPTEQRAERSLMNDGVNQVQDNPLETRLVVEVLERALAEQPQLGKGEIGVVVPYKNHVKAIQTAVNKAHKSGRLPALAITPLELVASVDSFQGQERDLIIMTFTRSNARGTVGFLKNWRRLNVAMTRAKRQLIMIGDLSTLSQQHPRSEDQADTAAEFKQAMAQLRSFVKERAHYMDVRQWPREEPVHTAQRAAAPQESKT